MSVWTSIRADIAPIMIVTNPPAAPTNPQVARLTPAAASLAPGGLTASVVRARLKEAEELEARGRFREAAEIYRADLEARCWFLVHNTTQQTHTQHNNDKVFGPSRMRRAAQY